MRSTLSHQRTPITPGNEHGMPLLLPCVPQTVNNSPRFWIKGSTSETLAGPQRIVVVQVQGLRGPSVMVPLKGG
jgi:hypothetical protein